MSNLRLWQLKQLHSTSILYINISIILIISYLVSFPYDYLFLSYLFSKNILPTWSLYYLNLIYIIILPICLIIGISCLYFYYFNNKIDDLLPAQKELPLTSQPLLSNKFEIRQNAGSEIARRKLGIFQNDSSLSDMSPLRRFALNNSTILSPNKPFETPTKPKEAYNFPTNTTPKYATSFPYLFTLLFHSNCSEIAAVNKVDDTLLEPSCSELTLDHYASLKLESLKLDLDSIDRYSTNMKVWLAVVVIKPLLKELRQNELAIEKLKQSFMSHSSFNTLPPSDKSAIQSGRVDVLSKYAPQDQSILERNKLEEFLGGSNIEYVKQRLSSFIEGYQPFDKFKFDSGGEWNGKQWNSSLPTDAQIVMNLFCAYMDNKVFNGKFTGKHFVSLVTGKSKDNLPKTLSIIQTKPAYYLLISDNKTQQIAIKSGRKNIFYCLAMFLYYIRTFLNNRLENISIFDNNNQLLRVLSDQYLPFDLKI